MQTRSQAKDRGAFELFPKLPTELRRKIWHETIRPRILPSKPILELYVCREARQFLLEVYEPCFKLQPPETPLMEYAISIYANFTTDIFLIDWNIAEGKIWERQWSEVLAPQAMAKLKYLAIEGDEWRELDPEDGMGRLDDGTDARMKIVEFTALETLSLVITKSEEYSSSDPVEQALEDVESDNWFDDDFDERRLVKSNGFHGGDDLVLSESSGLLYEMEEERISWKAPEVQLARIVKAVVDNCFEENRGNELNRE